jgi:predicted RNA-binding Zn-ribbon protein involved in translation (DUF1610 family)
MKSTTYVDQFRISDVVEETAGSAAMRELSARSFEMTRETRFPCSQCGERSELRAVIAGDIGGDRHEIFECPSCGHIEMQFASKSKGHDRPLRRVRPEPHAG